MRFFAHDGKAVHGPAVPEELLNLPGFDGDTLVCPVGSENSADWKPALSYPRFREALLAPPPKLAPPPPALPPPPPPPPPTSPCPRCAHPNPETARFCNDCAARMDGSEPAPPPAPEPVPAPEPLPTPEPIPAPELEPASAAEPAFAVSNPPLASLEPVPDGGGLEAALLSAAEASPPPAPRPAFAAAPSAWRKILIASFAGAALASGVVGWRLLRPAKRPAPSVADLNLPPPASPAPALPAAPAVLAAPAPAPKPAQAVAAAPASSPAPLPPPRPKTAHRPKKAAPAVDLDDLTKAPPPRSPAKRARRKALASKPKPKAKPAAVPPPAPEPKKEETLIESRAAGAEPAMPGNPPNGDAPSGGSETAAPAPVEDRGFLLPGVPRRVPPQSATKAKAAAPPDAAPAAAAGASSPDAADDGTTKQVREQFVFCSQLISQGAYADHFDTCLCAGARDAAPYRGRRGYYAAALKKAASAGTLETSASVTGIVLDGPVAKVTASWKSGASEKPRSKTENWQLEDGLWCRSP